MNHTPTPWRFKRNRAQVPSADVQAGPEQYATKHVAIGVLPEDAAFIVRACNAHDELVAALRDLHDACEHWENQNDPVLVAARAALAKVQPEAACSAL